MTADEEGIPVTDMLVDPKGRNIIVTEKALYIFDKKIVLKTKIPTDFFISGAALTKDGAVVCGSNEENKAYARVFNIDEDKWSSPIELSVSSVFPDTLIDGKEYEFYYADEKGVYGYDSEKKQSVKLLDYAASDIAEGIVFDFLPIAKGKFLAETEDANGRRLVMYSKVDAKEVKDKNTIIYGTTGASDMVKQAINDFNRQNTDYKIEIRDYAEEGEPEAKMAMDMISGDVPDVMDLSGLPVEQYAKKELLLDLMPYLEKDEELREDDILPSVLEAMKTEDKLYYLAPRFHVSAMIGKAEDIGSRGGWTFEEMKAFLQEKGKGAKITNSTIKSDMLFTFAETFSEYVDWGTGKCSFDSQEFKDLLKFCNQGKNDDGSYSGDDPGTHFLKKSGKLLFQTGYVTTEAMQVEKKMFESDIAFIGMPSKDKEGTYFSFDTKLSIYAKSEMKEEAWEFVKSLMSMEYQAKGDAFYDYPTRNDAFDMAMRTKTVTKSYTDELGRDISPIQRVMNVEDMEIKCEPLSKEEENAFRELIKRTKKCSNYNQQVTDIIMEEAAPYFMGEKNLEETVKIIQKRVQTLVNEGL